MYCKACGEENEHTAIYCKHDGAALKRGSALFQKGQVYKFCQACGGNVTSSQSYCMDCGSYLLQYERKEKGNITKSVSIKQFSFSMDIFSSMYVKRAIVPLIMVFFLLIIYSFFSIKGYEKIVEESFGVSSNSLQRSFRIWN
ncbi:MAG: hypothetical protein ACI35O_17040 [Bacillaceae bacterium]